MRQVIDIQLSRLTRDLRMGGGSATVKVVYDCGEFELTFQIDEIPTEEAEIQAKPLPLVRRFATDLAEAAQLPIQIPKQSDP